MLRVKEVGYDFFFLSLSPSLVLSISQLESIPFPSPSQLSPAQPSPAQLSPAQSSPVQSKPSRPPSQAARQAHRQAVRIKNTICFFLSHSLSLTHTLHPPSLPSVIDGKKRIKGKQKEKTKKKLSQHHAAVFSHFIDVDDDDPLPLPIVVSVSVSPL